MFKEITTLRHDLPMLAPKFSWLSIILGFPGSMGCFGNTGKALTFFTGGPEPTDTGLSRETARLYGGRTDCTGCGLRKPVGNTKAYHIVSLADPTFKQLSARNKHH